MSKMDKHDFLEYICMFLVYINILGLGILIGIEISNFLK